LIGGAFLFFSSDKKEFGLFALTYTPPLKEHWQLLEKHPASALPAFQLSVIPPGQFPHGAIKACTSTRKCTYWFTPSSSSLLRRANNSFKPKPLRGSA
jgi:hypothetical protein